jgi:hypothetical protein
MRDANSRAIILSLAAVLILTVAALAASLVIPFNVDEPATIRSLTGEAEIITPAQPTVNAADQARLNPDQTLNVLPGGQAVVTFALDDGHAQLVVYGPANVTLIESYHRATALGHALDRRRYTLALEQSQGRVDYFFAGTAPSFSDADITIHLPNGNYTPDSPCWRIDIPLTGDTSIEPINCNG